MDCSLQRLDCLGDKKLLGGNNIISFILSEFENIQILLCVIYLFFQFVYGLGNWHIGKGNLNSAVRYPDHIVSHYCEELNPPITEKLTDCLPQDFCKIKHSDEDNCFTIVMSPFSLT